MVSMTHWGTIQVDGGGGQFLNIVEVILGQYGGAAVLMMTSTVLTVVIVVRLVVVYVVSVGLQIAREVVRCADILWKRRSGL